MDEDGPGVRAATDPGLWSEFLQAPEWGGTEAGWQPSPPPFVLQWGREEWGIVQEGGRRAINQLRHNGDSSKAPASLCTFLWVNEQRGGRPAGQRTDL